MSSAKKQFSNRIARGKKFVSPLPDNPNREVTEARITQLLQTGIAHHQAGNRREAVRNYQLAYEIDSQNAVAIHLLGVIALQAGDYSTAIELISEAIRIQPLAAEFHLNLGSAWWELSEGGKTISCFERAIELDNSCAMAHNNLANVLRTENQIERAVEHYQLAVELDPVNAEFLCNQAAVWIELGELQTAENNLRKALERNSQLAEAYSNLAVIEARRGNATRAIELYQTALQRQPKMVKVWNGLGNLLAEQGAVEESRLAFTQADQLAPHAIRKLKTVAVCPMIPESAKEIGDYRQKLEAKLDELTTEANVLQGIDWANLGVAVPFHLAYHGLNDRTLRLKWASIFEPAFCQEQMGSKAIRRDAMQPAHVGFVVADRHVPVFWKFMGGLIERLGNRDLAVSVLGSAQSHSELSSSLGSKVPQTPSTSSGTRQPNDPSSRFGFIRLSSQLTAAAETIGQAGIDLLFHFEPGADAFSYFLPFCRAARLQCTSWGIPVTSGIPAMTDFLSSEMLEPEGAEEHYSEQLWRLKNLPVYYRHPTPAAQKSRRDFGFSDSVRLYGCLHSLFKLHPQFDDTLAAILRTDGNARILLLQGRHAYWAHLLQQRLARTMPDVSERIVFLPAQSPSEFLALMKGCDVLLDPFPFGGGATTYDAVSVGAPTVTLPGEFMRGRVTSAIWRTLDIDECIASSQTDYVDRAIRIAHDREYQNEISQKILQRNSVLFENDNAVKEIRDWMLQRIHADSIV